MGGRKCYLGGGREDCIAPVVDLLILLCAVPTKKHVLMKWERSQSTCHPSLLPARLHQSQKGDKRNSSPLFDEVSSDGEDFEVTDRGGGRRRVPSTSSDGHRRTHSHTAVQMFSPVKESITHRGAGQMEEEEEGVLGTEEATVVGPRTPVNEDGSVDGYSAKPSDDSNSSLDTSVVGKSDVETSRGLMGGEVGPKTPPPPPTQHQTEDTRDVTQSFAGTALAAAPAGSSREGGDEGDLGGDGMSDASKCDLFEGGSDYSFRQDEDSPMSPHNKAGNQGGKKKVRSPPTPTTSVMLHS